ncbi:hypothetical protein ACLOJK_011957 [Asimina triloba]
MNNWLAFSLTPQEFPSHSQDHHSSPAVSRFLSTTDSTPHSAGLGFNSPQVSTSNVAHDDCLDLSSDPTALVNISNLRQDTSFGILEAFNRSSNRQQDWNMNFKTSSELSMLVGGSSNSNQKYQSSHGKPKLEDFFGGSSHSFSDNSSQKLTADGNGGISAAFENSGDDYVYTGYSLQTAEANSIPPTSTTTTTAVDCGSGSGMSTNSIGLSMIKTWLRNQPGLPQKQQQQQTQNKNEAAAVAANGGVAERTTGMGAATTSQSLSLSMSTGSQSSPALPLLAENNAGVGGGNCGGENSSSVETQPKTMALDGQTGAIEPVARKSIDTFGQRTSIYRGVTRHRWTGRYEAHLWDNSCRREGQTRKGRQGGYDKEEKAARAYDLAALKYWGKVVDFPEAHPFIEELQGTQEEAAEAYDIAAIKFRGLSAVTNFDMSRYDVNSIMQSSSLPIGGGGKRFKDMEPNEASTNGQRTDSDNLTSRPADGISSYGSQHNGWQTIAFQQAQPVTMHYPYDQQRSGWCKQEEGTSTGQGIQDLQQLQLGNTHNFFQPHQQPSMMHNLMSLDTSSLEHSTGSTSVVYNNGTGGSSGNLQGVVGGGNHGYMMPMNALISVQSNDNHSSFGENDVKQLGYENMVASNADPYTGKSLYYLSQQSPADLVKPSPSGDGQTSPCSNWMPNSSQTLGSRSNNLTLCPGAPIFSVWNDS